MIRNFNFSFKIYTKLNKKTINNALLYGPELIWHMIEGSWSVLGCAQPKHINHLPCEITTLTCPLPFLAQLVSCAITNHSSGCDCCCQHQHWCQHWHQHCRQKLTSSSVPI